MYSVVVKRNCAAICRYCVWTERAGRLATKYEVTGPTSVTLRGFAYKVERDLRRNLKTRHVYKHLYPWRNLTEFTDHIYNNIIYNDGGIVAVNKPYGVPQKQYAKYDEDETGPRKIMSTLSSLGSGECGYGLADALPGMKTLLNVENLELVCSTERYTSGVAIFATHTQAEKYVQDAYKRARGMDIPFQRFWTVTRGIPDPWALQERVSVTLEPVNLFTQGEDISKQPVIVEKPSRKSVQQGLVKTSKMEYRTVSRNREMEAALVEITTTRTKWHLVRVYAAHRALSILGDGLYGSRVKYVLGRPVIISHHNAAAYSPQTLPDSWIHKLSLSHQSVPLVPTHIHLHQVLLPARKGGQVILITAPPPHYFLWTCKQLGVLHSGDVLQYDVTVGEEGVAAN